jgi:hypothetical protein
MKARCAATDAQIGIGRFSTAARHLITASMPAQSP